MIKQKIFLSFSSRIFLQAMQFATTIVVARILGPDVLGTLAYGLAFASSFAIIGDLGTGSAHIKLIAEGEDETDCITTYSYIKIFLILLYLIITTAAIGVKYFLINDSFKDQETLLVVFIYIAITAIGMLMTIASSTFAAKMEQVKQDVPNLVQTFLYQVFRLVVTLLGYKALTVAFSNLVAVILSVPIYIYFFRSYKFGVFKKKFVSRYVKIALPVIIVIVCQTIIFSVDKLLLEQFRSLKEVGFYSAAYSVSGYIKTIEGVAGILLFPFFSHYIAVRDFPKVNLSIKKFEKFTVIFIFPSIVLMSIFSDKLTLLILGKKFIETIPILSIVTFSTFFGIFYLPYTNIIFGSGYYKLVATFWSISVAIFLISVFILSSKQGFDLSGSGIAYSTLIVNIFLSIIFVITTKRKFPEINVLPSRKLLGIGVFLSIVLFAGYTFTTGNQFMQVTFAVLYLILFWVGSYLLKLIDKDDFKLFLEIISFGKLKNYIKSEIKSK